MNTTDTTRFDRFDYGAFRRDWRARYAALSSEIRDLKQQRAVQSRTPAGAAATQSRLTGLRKAAAAMMENRSEIDALRRSMADKMARVRPASAALAKAA